MTMTLLAALALLTACSRAPQQQDAQAASKAEPAAEPLKATIWTTKGELYLEYPALVQKQKARFAIHLTRLTDFKAVKEAVCEVHLDGELFPCDLSTHPGIFGANVTPKAAGSPRLRIQVKGKDLSETFEVGEVKVATDASAAEKPDEKKEETIAFSKEQQWALDFGTQLAGQQDVRDALRVAGEVAPRTGGEVNVAASTAGRVVIERSLTTGTPVERGAELASIVPPLATPSEITSLQLAEAEAKVALEQAQRDRARSDRLLAAGAAPARRAEEARALEATAQARLNAAQARLVQYEATRKAEGADQPSRRFAVRAPISGVIAEARAVGGSFAEVGTVLFRIVDTDSVYVNASVPEAESARLRSLAGAEIESGGDGAVRTAKRLVAIGRIVDPASRTLPVTYEVDNRDRRLALNQSLFVRLLFSQSQRSVVIPSAAVVDDAGRPVVFVQKAGETFERRPVKLGIPSGDGVQVLEGVANGERVVSKGAYLIRLSTMSNSVPAHGHVH